MTIKDPQSVADLFLQRVAASPQNDALLFPDGSAWQTLSWQAFGDRVKQIAGGLRALGLEDEQRVAILCSTRHEWILADVGILCAGGATTTIYPSNTPAECVYIIKDSGTTVVIAENDGQVKKLLEKRGEMPALKKVVVIDGAAAGDDGWVITLADLEARGADYHKQNPGAYEATIARIRKDSLATLIYTSGTTGTPKGVELTHDCWLYEGEGIEALGLLKPEDRHYLWLPLAHSFGKVLEVAQLRIGFATAVDGRIDKLVENLGVVKPTFVAAVPRIFEKVHNKVVAGAKESGLKLKIFQWAFGVGREVSKLVQSGQQPSGFLAFKNSIADKLVFSKLKNRFGGRLRYFVSGSAPLSRDMAEFFHAAGILILEGYGLTETSAASFVNRPGAYKFGTVGPPVPGTELKIAEDGEILIKGRGVMRGYHNLPEATKETIDDAGWLHTGDIGEIDAAGFLRITDRKKDLIKTSGGKYVAPQHLEGKLKAICPFISQVVVHGDNRNFCSALIALDEESIKKWAGENGLGGKDYAQIAADDKTKALLQGFVTELNKGLASYETIKRFAILSADLTEKDGDLTPSLKLKRKVVEKKYMHLLDAFYEGAMEG